MKLPLVWDSIVIIVSHPSWGAWIEIAYSRSVPASARPSHPSWGAWIEMRYVKNCTGVRYVAPLMGCVD